MLWRGRLVNCKQPNQERVLCQCRTAVVPLCQCDQSFSSELDERAHEKTEHSSSNVHLESIHMSIIRNDFKKSFRLDRHPCACRTPCHSIWSCAVAQYALICSGLQHTRQTAEARQRRPARSSQQAHKRNTSWEFAAARLATLLRTGISVPLTRHRSLRGAEPRRLRENRVAYLYTTTQRVRIAEAGLHHSVPSTTTDTSPPASNPRVPELSTVKKTCAFGQTDRKKSRP